MLVRGVLKPFTEVEVAFAASLNGERVIDGQVYIRADRARRLLKFSYLSRVYTTAIEEKWSSFFEEALDEHGRLNPVRFYRKADVLATAEKRKQMRK